jgi:hypothetical protein
MKEKLKLPPRLQRIVTAYLDERRLLTTRLVVTDPDYQWISVEVAVRAKRRIEPTKLKVDIDSELHRFINPITGWHDGSGWPFGQELLASDVYMLIQKLPGVEHIDTLNLFLENIETGDKGKPLTKVDISLIQLPCSYRSDINVV